MSTDNKTTKTSRPRLRKSIIAYIDFLGTKANMRKGEEYLTEINELYEYAIQRIANNNNMMSLITI